MTAKTHRTQSRQSTANPMGASMNATLQGENRPDLITAAKKQEFSFLRMVEGGNAKPFDLGNGFDMGAKMVDQMTMLNKSDDLYKRDPETGGVSVLQGGGDYTVGYKPEVAQNSPTIWDDLDEQNGRVYDGAELFDNPAPGEGERFSWKLSSDVIDNALIRPKKHSLDTDYDPMVLAWQQDTGDKSSRKSPSMALKFWLKGPTVAECASVMVALMLDTVRQQLGDAAFDKMVRNSQATYFICPNPSQTPLTGRREDPDDDYITPIGLYGLPEDKKRDQSGKFAGLLPGDTVYFRNKSDYAAKSKAFLTAKSGADPFGTTHEVAGSWSGENCVYMGENDGGEQLFSGFGMLSQTESQILDALASHYQDDTGETTSAAAILSDGGGLQTSKVTDNGPDGWRLTMPE
jgi:hypothetical protein